MFTEKIASLWDQLRVVFSDFAFTDFLDICLVAFVLYSVIKLIRETKAIQLAKGLLLFGVAYLVIYLLDMQASEFIFKKVFGEIIIVLVILFQPELRHMLESVGRRSITKLNLFGVRDEESERNQRIKESIYAVCKCKSYRFCPRVTLAEELMSNRSSWGVPEMVLALLPEKVNPSTERTPILTGRSDMKVLSVTVMFLWT